MPRQLKEINNFNLGIILNASEKDIPGDSASFSLNVDPLSKNGILDAINSDRLIFILNEGLSSFNTPATWNQTNNDLSVEFNYNKSKIEVEDISIFGNSSVSKITVTGAKGYEEQLSVYNIEPHWEKVLVNNTLVPTLAQAAETEDPHISSRTLNVEADTAISLYSTEATIDAAFVDNDIYKSDGTFYGKCTGATVSGTPNLTFSNGLLNQVVDQQTLYTDFHVKYKPASTVAVTADSIAFLGYENEITIHNIVSGDLTASGFDVNGNATINVLDATPTNYDDSNNDYFTITTPDGISISYIFDDSTAVANTGNLSSGKVLIGMSDVASSVTAIATQVKNAIESPNGHGKRISITQASGVLSLSYVHLPLDNYISIGDYISFCAEGSTFSGRTAFEIMQITGKDTASNTFYIQRGLFGTALKELSSTTTYNIFSNRVTLDREQTRTNRGSVYLGGWSQYSGNNIGGSSNYLIKTKSTATREKCGVIIASSGNHKITYSSTDKTITFGTSTIVGSGDIQFNEGETINIYHSTTNDNHGYSGKILKKTTNPLVLTMDTAPVSLEEETDTVYLESNLVKNHTFNHALTNSSQTVGASAIYKCNDWQNYAYAFNTDDGGNAFNYYTTSTLTDVSLQTTGGRWQRIDSSSTNLAGDYYPFNGVSSDPTASTDKFLRIGAQYKEIKPVTNAAIAIGDISFETSLDVDSYLAKNDIIYVDDGSNPEYMKVTGVKGTRVTVQRGLFDTSEVAHDAGAEIDKSINTLVRQEIPKEKLLADNYTLTFYAKENTANSGTTAYGYLSLRLNGGNFDSFGVWQESSKDTSNGYVTDSYDEIAQEDRWISFQELKANDFTAVNTSGVPNDNQLDDVWRKFRINITLPNEALNTDLRIEFSSRGKSGVDVDIDLVDLHETPTYIISTTDNNQITESKLFDNKGDKELLVYNGNAQRLQCVPFFQSNELQIGAVSPLTSLSSSSTIMSSNKIAAMTPNNREMHIGFGSEPSDTNPQWVGYPNHKLFGKDYSNDLYQDEDAIPQYGGDVRQMSSTIDKICLAGEYEYCAVAGTVSAMVITHYQHPFVVGDNIVVRQWGDSANTWDGAGIWIVSVKDPGTNGNSFTCVPNNTLDADPSYMPTRVCYRPYYYYGVKDGEPFIYRINPAIRNTESDGTDATYPAGQIEKSLPLDFNISSICTFYNKNINSSDTNTYGLGGGQIYALASGSNEVKVLNVALEFNKWKEDAIIVNSTLFLDFRGFKFSNDHTNGNQKNGTEGVHIKGNLGLASSSTPYMQYSGILSDILETKGPTSDTDNLFTMDATGIEVNQPKNFDTRLWVQSRPESSDSSFNSFGRYLFCSKTESGNTSSGGTIYCADRTPCMTRVNGCEMKWDENPGWGSDNWIKMDAAPGIAFSHGDWHGPYGDGGPIADFDPHGKSGYFNHWTYYQNSTGGQHIDFIQQIFPRSGEQVGDGQDEVHAGVFSNGGIAQPIINFGWNIGWDCTYKNLNTNVKVAKYGLFPVSDNDRDGVLDGTGVVVPSNKSITDTTYKNGPYGNLHHRVSSHAVGLIGERLGTWWKHFGQMRAGVIYGLYYGQTLPRSDEGSSQGWIGNYREDMPEKMGAGPCIWICTDMHAGDIIYQKGSYNFASMAQNTLHSETTKTAIQLTTATEIREFQAGDMIYVDTAGASGDWLGNAQSTVIDYVDYDNGKIIVPLTWSATADGKIYPMSHQITTVMGASYPFGTIPNVDRGNWHHWSYWETAHHDDIINKLDGDFMTEEVDGANSQGGVFEAGHFTRGWYTPPAYSNGGPISGAFHSNGNPQVNYAGVSIPGIIFPIEKLNYRAGYLMRPFQIDNDDFQSLVIGQGTCVDMPSYPDAVYHKQEIKATVTYANNGGTVLAGATSLVVDDGSGSGNATDAVFKGQNIYLSTGVLIGQVTAVASALLTVTTLVDVANDQLIYVGYSGYTVNSTDANTTNQFASRLYINSPSVVNDILVEENSIMYISDLNFQYPSSGNKSGVAMYSSGSDFSNQSDATIYNESDSGDIWTCGDVVDYHITDATISGDDYRFRDAVTHPIVEIDADNLGLKEDLFADATVSGHASAYRKTNALHGLCLSIIDGTTGAIQTRYVVGSKTKDATEANNLFNKDTAATENMLIQVHYPFAHKPTNSDKFYLWKHHNVATAPIRLFKETLLDHGLGSVYKADPILGAPIYKNSGALSDISSQSSVGTATTSAKHNLSTNDYVKITDATIAAYNDIYKITVTSPTNFTFISTAGDGDDGATGNWELMPMSTGDSTIEHQQSSATNPILLDLSYTIFKTSFGGLDMRKLRKRTVSGVADSSDDITLTTTVNHLFDVGDTISFDSSDADQDGTYIIKADNGSTTLAVTNPDHTSATGILSTNQWEALILATSGSSAIGELRSGLTSWDKGNTTGNILRYDKATATEEQLYFNVSEASVTIVTNSVANAAGDYFLKNNDYFYKLSYVYDGYQEGPLSSGTWEYTNTSTRAALGITIRVKSPSRRLTHICIYRKDNPNDTFKLVRQISTAGAWAKEEGEIYVKTIVDGGQVAESYESRTGMSEVLDTFKVKYGLSQDIDGYLFAGDCSHEQIENASNKLFRSKPGWYSTFDWANDYLDLKSKPTALANFHGRLYAFDKSNIYKINPHTLVIEDVYEGIGCLNSSSLAVTEYGIFFADKNGAYLHNGTAPLKISESIQKGGDTTKFEGLGADNIDDVSWTSTIGKDTPENISVIFDSDSLSALFLFKLKDSKSGVQEVETISKSFIWSYNMGKQRWDLWELGEDNFIGKPCLGENGEVLIPKDGGLYKSRGGRRKKLYTWVSKKISLNEDSIIKVYNKIKINGITDSLTQGGSYIESSDRLLLATSTGDIANADITHASSTSNYSNYKISGLNKKGRWLQIKLEDMTEPVDSIGVLYRRKSTK